MKPIEIKPGIFWVGAIDWAIRDFHGYVTPRGTSYNNYLVMDEQVTLVDTVKLDFAGTMLDNVRSLTDPSKIVNIVINHIEADHVSGIETVMELCPKAALYMTEKAKTGLERHYDISGWDIRTVKTGDTLSTGKKTLEFIETAMLHWPDSMMTYIPGDRLLISQDAFGQHLATSELFDDGFAAEASMTELDDAVVEYYANILMPFGGLIKRKLEEIGSLEAGVDMIAPDHGVVWRKNAGWIMKRYMDMATGKAELGVSIIYDTMWHSTEMMSVPVMEGVRAEGVECKVMKLRSTAMSEAVTELWKTRGTIIGTPTLNNGMFPSVAQFLSYIKGLRPKGRIAGAFGSYGWSGGAVNEVYAALEAMGLETVGPGVECKYRPSADDKDKCYEFGREFARRVKEYHKGFQF